MTAIRPYRESDAESVGQLIADTYSRFNLSFATPAELGKLLGPFRYAWSAEPAHREAIAQVIQAPLVFVAEEKDEVVGVLRGRKEGWQACSSGGITIGGGSGGGWWSNSSKSLRGKR